MTASTSIGRSISGRSPFSLRNPPRADTPIRVPMVSTNAVMKMVSTTGNARQVSAPRKSSCQTMGVMLGGMLTIARGGAATCATKATSAVTTMPSRIAPGNFRITRIAIRMKPNMATTAGGEVRLPACTGAPGTPSFTSPVSFRPMKVRNKPIPTAKLYRSTVGTPSTIHCRRRKTVITMKAAPAMKIAASAVCQLNPKTLHTVKAINAFSPM